MHSNVMHRFMVQAFQDPPLCSSTIYEGSCWSCLQTNPEAMNLHGFRNNPKAMKVHAGAVFRIILKP
jgi:hypothetical protein